MMEGGTDVIRFIEEIESKIDYYRQEYELTYAQTVGALDMIKFALLKEAFDEQEE